MRIALRQNKYAIMFGNPKNVLDHLEGCSKSDDLLKQHVYFPYWPTANTSHLIAGNADKLVSNKKPKTIKSIKRSMNANRNYSQLILARTMPVTSSRAFKLSAAEHFHAGQREPIPH